MTDDDDDLDMDEWMTLSEAEQERRVFAAEREYFEWLDSLTILQRYRYDRGSALRSLAQARRMIAIDRCPEVIVTLGRERIAVLRRRLLALRIHRSTGVRPGTA
jgi:hypothetical protein